MEHVYREGVCGVIIDVDLQCVKGREWVLAAGCLERGCALGFLALALTLTLTLTLARTLTLPLTPYPSPYRCSTLAPTPNQAIAKPNASQFLRSKRARWFHASASLQQQVRGAKQ